MQYKQNIHILLPAEKFEELRQLGHRVNLSRSELVRNAINMLLKKYKRNDYLRDRQSEV
ncbi:MAG: ribbon-helix-helix domain-containing protein [Planctomycetota bacterium]|jgi:metal-responsive CopG/Arc/MetJ family transcriptional regulator